MSVTNTENTLFEELKPIVNPIGVNLIDVEILTHESEPVIRVVIDSDQGVGTVLCEKVMHHVQPVIEMDDDSTLREAQIEVTSPGVRRKLRRREEYERFAGRTVEIRCYAPVRDKKEWTGTLKGYDDENIKIELNDGSEIDLPDEKVASVRLYFDAEDALSSGGSQNNE